MNNHLVILKKPYLDAILNGRKQMEKLMKQMGKGKMPNLQSLAAQMRR